MSIPEAIVIGLSLGIFIGLVTAGR
ncbi:hypothetical protein SEA_POTATOSPLIT_71 [Mycobacterium phage PotatoSplit]|nr:recombination directionality factor [Mycobacterium phage Tiffany]YP_009198495.1 recombination directionality factor [Mycobacterium phage MarQuardt]YP_009219132.1 recombination directionality factor [Mycobacterium phage Anubis]AJA41853.1 hypothetical protein PBI_SPIKE509_70 [Mycobacterium phage Spike509]AJA41944.1 hypothetical protein PBI_PHOXY_70 [Mycobacterium phage Phoxy]AJA43458.1 hypothetical protein PBI_TAURUS_71 [Mycobacterium phage Taurus]ALA11698.1 hypothetical protein SEA_DAHUDSON